MTKEREALKLALEALEKKHPGVRTDLSDALAYRDIVKTASAAIKEALAQPEQSEQEPVAHIGMIDEEHFADVCRKAKGNSNTQLYTSPNVAEPRPKREWVSMVHEDVQEVRQRCGSMVEAVQYINNWLKEKNHD